MAYKKELVKSKLSYIDTFDQEGPAMISAMRYLTLGVFEYIEITSVIDVDKKIKYTECIMR